MKLEMGESLILSWLRHYKNCQLVQSNWKPSGGWENYNEEKVAKVKDLTEKYFYSKYKIDLFGKYIRSDQIIKQGEIDVLGIEIEGGKIKIIYGVDIAFHENGLHYGDDNTNARNVLKKMIRTALIILQYFNPNKETEINIIFASPKIMKKSYDLLNKRIEELKTIFSKLGIKFKLKLYYNETFEAKILDPTISKSEFVSDTSELFMRSYQLSQFYNKSKKRSSEKLEKIIKGQDEIKIGIFVREAMKILSEENLLTEKDIRALLNKELSNELFKLKYPFLKLVKSNNTDEIRKVKGYYRYWSGDIKINGRKYIICNHWYETNKQLFIKWLSNFIKS